MPHTGWFPLAASVVLLSTCSAAGTGSIRQPTSDGSLLLSSEIAYAESGGIAGRVREARLVASNGKISVEYRPGNARLSDTPHSGTLDPARYLELWREADRLDLWTVESPKPTRGADLMLHSLRLERDGRTHEVRWDDGASGSRRVRDAAAFGRRVLDAARDVTMEK